VSTPILQFGTGRFLQAHADLFVSQALAQGQALGGITVVQSTDSPQSSARAAALAHGYRVELRGMQQGRRIEETVQVNAVRAVWHARRDWTQLRDAMANSVQVVISNTADTGYALDDSDTAALLHSPTTAPRSYPAKLVALLHHRWQRQPEAPLTLYPCELVSRNGDTLRMCGSTACGSIPWWTASCRPRWSPPVRWPSPMRCGPSSTSRAWCFLAATRPWW
jgi:tagaturonate reductase